MEAPPTARRILLSGYWQTAEHFLKIREKAQSQMVPTSPLTSAAQQLARELERPGSVFVHLRRGDYGKWGVPLLSPNYFRAASALLRQFVREPRWYIFSEDQQWCRENLGFLDRPDFVALKGADADCEELWPMSRCHGGIIANSTFSWWAAALGDRPERPVVAPLRWHGPQSPAREAMMLPAWHVLDVVLKEQCIGPWLRLHSGSDTAPLSARLVRHVPCWKPCWNHVGNRLVTLKGGKL